MIKFYFVIIFLSTFVFCSSCTMKGYYVDIGSNYPDRTIERVRKLLTENGFEKDNKIRGSSQIERYKCEPPEVKRTFFSRNADFWVHVDIRHSSLTGNSNSENIKIHIYNVYVGNKPEIKPFLLKTADSIEKAIKLIAPDIIVDRDEGLTGIPFI